MQRAEFLNYKVSELLGRPQIAGQKFGIELELEGRNVGLGDVATRGWNRHQEGSLRGESIEYTTAGAKTFEEVQKDVDHLFAKFKKEGVKIKDSIRTSTHVHLNFSDQKIKTVVNFFTLFTMLEEVLQYYSGDDRRGNLFCISTREAEGIVGVLVSCLGKCDLSTFAGDRFKYAACNLSTLYKFGTIEVRCMKGAESAEHVNRWLSILNDIYKYSLTMVSPADLVRDLSLLGAERFMQSIFTKENYDELIKKFPRIATLHYSLMEGARILQVFAYEFDEDFKRVVEVKEKPKGGLPINILVGPHRGQNYCIYKPDGNPWFCGPLDRSLKFWRNGERVFDDHRIQWSEARRRFVVHYPDGEEVACRWRFHHEINDEGPPRLIMAMPPEEWWNEEEEHDEDFEPEWDEDEERDDDF